MSVRKISFMTTEYNLSMYVPLFISEYKTIEVLK